MRRFINIFLFSIFIIAFRTGHCAAAKAQIAVENRRPTVCQWGITKLRPMLAAPYGFTGRGTFTMASSSAWAPGPAGLCSRLGEYRFHGEGGGRYHGRGGFEAEHGHYAHATMIVATADPRGERMADRAR